MATWILSKVGECSSRRPWFVVILTGSLQRAPNSQTSNSLKQPYGLKCNCCLSVHVRVHSRYWLGLYVVTRLSAVVRWSTRAASRTRTRRGTATASPATTVRRCWPERSSRHVTTSPTVPTASAICSPRNASSALSQSQVRIVWCPRYG